MAQITTQGTNWKVEGRSIELFGLHGSHSGNYGVIGINFGSAEEPAYVLTQVDSAPAKQDVLDVIEQDEAAGNLDKIATVLVSSRVAVRLFLDGTITPEMVREAEETQEDTSKWLEDGGVYDAIKIPAVKFGAHTFPVIIFSENKIGSSTLATLDADGHIV